MVEVVFTKTYANKKKGDRAFYDGILATKLISDLKVAKKYKKKSK